MNEQEIKELIAAGMELGSHTYSHNPLAAIDEKYLVWVNRYVALLAEEKI